MKLTRTGFNPTNTLGVLFTLIYLQEIGLTYLHLMPIFKAPEGENDGGYAVSSYRELHPPIGTMEQLASLLQGLRKVGISLVVDLVINHTSDQHLWAQRVRAGDLDFHDIYRIYADLSTPEAYERNSREIFPDEHTGVFTFFFRIFDSQLSTNPNRRVRVSEFGQLSIVISGIRITPTRRYLIAWSKQCFS